MSSIERRATALALLIAALLAGGAWFQHRGQERRRAAEQAGRALRTQALAAAKPQVLRARYVHGDPPPEGSSDAFAPLGPELDRALLRWGWKAEAGIAAAWCPATAKLAFFREGWVWVTDANGSVLRSVWFEPDLQAAGRLRWSGDGGTLWIRADGWRRWLGLELKAS